MTALSPSLPALVEALPAEPAASDVGAFTRERQVAFLALAATVAPPKCGATIALWRHIPHPDLPNRAGRARLIQ
jgi:hypothetical protein